MNMKNKYILLSMLSSVMLVPSCNDFLDEMPDDRADLETVEKLNNMLVDCYSVHSPAFILRFSSDNVEDSGKQFSSLQYQEQLYRWEDVTEVSGNDVPKNVYEGLYSAIGSANILIDAADKLDDPAVAPIKAEAMVCRAYNMFQLANTFCMGWNPEKADEYLGLPYPTVPGESVDSRGTLRELYKHIDEDIEAALPLLNDEHIKVPKYHFTTTAAYAFAARFNLFYLNYDKAIEYATKALGPNPRSVLRNTAAYDLLAGSDDISNAYMKDNANILLIPAYSIAGRCTSGSYRRFGHNRPIITYETFWAKGMWGSGSGSNTFREAHMQYGSNESVVYPKLFEQFEVTDKVAQTGYAHIVESAFTYDETLLVRAEAYALKGDFASACADLNDFASVRMDAVAGSAKRPVFTEDSINAFYDALPDVPAVVRSDKDKGIKKPLHPQGFTVAEGTQTNLIHLILQLRRLETMYLGQRFIDIKRYGIEFSHYIDGEKEPLRFVAGDSRGAIQLPEDVLTAKKGSLEPNPRKAPDAVPAE